MHEKDSVTDDMIDSYLRDELSDEELAEFELNLIQDPALLKRVQEAELFYEALRQGLSNPPLTAIKMSAFTWIKQPLSMAAMLLLGVALTVNVTRDGSIPEPNRESGFIDGLAVNSVVNLMQTRSSADELHLDSGIHLLQIDVGVTLTNTSYLVEFSDASGNLTHQYEVRPDGNGIVRVITPASMPGQQRLRVYAPGLKASAHEFVLNFN